MTGEDVCERLCRLGQPGVHAPKLLVILAHPDDEVLALGGRLEWLGESLFVTVTDGVPLDGHDARNHGFATLQDYRAARRAELAEALRKAGLDETRARTLRLQDGRLISDQLAALSLVALTQLLLRTLGQFEPDAVLTHPYEGGHPDHDACAFAVHLAVRCAGETVPIIEAPFYHATAGGMETGVFPGGGGYAVRLLPEQKANKRALLACFASQADTLQAFGIDVERFRTAPAYDFARPPHEGTLHYESYPWGMDGNRFCALATGALRELGC